MECVAVCPAQDALQLSLPPRATTVGESGPATVVRWHNRVVKPHILAAALALLFFGSYLLARATGNPKCHATFICRWCHMQTSTATNSFIFSAHLCTASKYVRSE